jgi:D-alanyl-D-alanine carboxypeptidase (penicillin-binding protein 5/6)
VQTSPNTLLRTFPGVDGLKTGFIEESGYNITLTAQREGTRFIAVILGAPSTADRSRDGSTLLSWAFDSFTTVQPRIPQIEPARLWKGREKYASLVPEQGLDFTAPSGRGGQIWFSVQMDGPLIAPVQQGQRVGYMVFADESGELYRAPLVSATEHRRGNIFVRIWHSIVLLFVR